MKLIKNIAVAIDLSDTDDTVLRYARYLGNQLNLKKIHLIHVVPSIFSFENVGNKFTQNIQSKNSLIEKVKGGILEKVEPIFEDGVEPTIEVLEGSPYQTFIRSAEKLKAQLVVVGRKVRSEGSGITAQKIARNFNGNVLIVPERTTMKIKKITVPIDFSENSARALKAALDISKKIEKCSVRCVHVVKHVPATYLNLKIRTELDAQYRLAAIENWGEFMKENGWKTNEITIDYLQEIQPRIVDQLSVFLKNTQTDLVIIGAKGHSAFDDFFYGSVTENLVNEWVDRPILVVR